MDFCLFYMTFTNITKVRLKTINYCFRIVNGSIINFELIWDFVNSLLLIISFISFHVYDYLMAIKIGMIINAVCKLSRLSDYCKLKILMVFLNVLYILFDLV